MQASQFTGLYFRGSSSGAPLRGAVARCGLLRASPFLRFSVLVCGLRLLRRPFDAGGSMKSWVRAFVLVSLVTAGGYAALAQQVAPARQETARPAPPRARRGGGDARKRRDLDRAARAAAPRHAGDRGSPRSRRHRHARRPRRQGSRRPCDRVPGRREQDADAREHHLPHRVDEQADHQRGDHDALRRGQAAPERSGVSLHPGLQAAARRRREGRTRERAARHDHPRSPHASFGPVLRLPERRARSATLTAPTGWSTA